MAMNFTISYEFDGNSMAPYFARADINGKPLFANSVESFEEAKQNLLAKLKVIATTPIPPPENVEL